MSHTIDQAKEPFGSFPAANPAGRARRRPRLVSMERESSAGRRTLRAALGVYAERRALVMVALGFSAGLPYFLIFDTLSAWLRDSGLSLEVIGFFSLVTLVSSFKFLWAPLVDRARVPLLTELVGHRRSWMLVCQGVIMLGLWLMAGADPSRGLGMIAVFAVFVGFSSATQDIAIDAWRIEAADVSRQGAMAAAYQWGYRVGDYRGRRGAAAARRRRTAGISRTRRWRR